MAQTCDQCKKVVYKLRFMGEKLWLGVDCGCARLLRIQRSTVNPFNITLDHVHDAFGNKVHVENIRQMEQAEKNYGFQSVVLNSDAQNFDDPPQQRRITVGDLYKRKFSQGARR